jgi:hypothetical protein
MTIDRVSWTERPTQAQDTFNNLHDAHIRGWPCCPALIELKVLGDLPLLREVLACTTGEQYVATLKAKGFKHDDNDRWIRLGAFRVEGLLPSTRQLDARQHAAGVLTSIAQQGNLNNAGQQRVKDILDRIAEAAEWCREDHPAAKRERLAIKNDRCRIDQWRELGAIELRYLCDEERVRLTTVLIATQLSAKIPIDRGQLPEVASVEQARRIQTGLLGQGGEIERTLLEVGNDTQHLVVWMPKNPNQAERIAATWRKAGRRFNNLERLTFLTNYDKHKGADSTREILDLWQHPLLNTDKWGEEVSETKFLTPAMTYVYTGKDSPGEGAIHVAMIPLMNVKPNAHVGPQAEQWRTTLLEEQGQTTLLVDIAHAERWKVQKKLEDARARGDLTGCTGIDAPKPSHSSAKDAMRSTIACHFDISEPTPDTLYNNHNHFHTNTFAAEIVINSVRAITREHGAMLGWAELLTSDDALLLDVSNQKAFYRLRDLCSELIPISRSCAVVRTHADAAEWSQALTQLWKAQPEAYGERLRLKGSVSDHPVFAEVAATKTELRNSKFRKGLAPTEPEEAVAESRRVTVQIDTGEEGDWGNWLPKLMQAIGAHVNLDLQQGNDNGELLVGQWRPGLTTTGHWTSKVTLQLNNSDEIRVMNNFLKTKGVRIHGRDAPITVDSVALDLQQEAAAANRPRHRQPG